MTDSQSRARDVIAKLCPNAKDVWVGRFGRVCVTFRGDGAARKAVTILAPALAWVKVVPGFDEGKATEMRQGRLRDVPVWRVHGVLKGCE